MLGTSTCAGNKSDRFTLLLQKPVVHPYLKGCVQEDEAELEKQLETRGWSCCLTSILNLLGCFNLQRRLRVHRTDRTET